MKKRNNPVAKFQSRYNKAVVHKDRKREAKKRGEFYEEDIRSAYRDFSGDI